MGNDGLKKVPLCGINVPESCVTVPPLSERVRPEGAP